VTPLEGVLLALAGLAAGVANAVAGGGSLLSFPALLAVGYPAVDANVTNTVSLWPGYLSGAAAYREDLQVQRDRVVALGVTAALGGLAGTVLLLVAPPGVFEAVVPYLVLVAVVLLAAQPTIATVVRRRADQRAAAGRTARPDHASVPLHLTTFAAATYGGYFGGGLGVILLAVLGIFLPDDLTRLNGVKNALSLVVNTVALVGFGLFGPVAWGAVAVVGPASLAGGVLGSRLARRISATVLRRIVVVWGTAVAIRLLIG
jgi:uncharacterized membrane protein YfcA